MTKTVLLAQEVGAPAAKALSAFDSVERKRGLLHSKMAKLLFGFVFLGSCLIFFDFREAKFNPMEFVHNLDIEITVTLDPCQFTGPCDDNRGDYDGTASSSSGYVVDEGNYHLPEDSMYVDPDRQFGVDWAHDMGAPNYYSGSKVAEVLAKFNKKKKKKKKTKMTTENQEGGEEEPTTADNRRRRLRAVRGGRP